MSSPRFIPTEIYFDRFGQILIIPIAYTETWTMAELDHTISLDITCTNAELGKAAYKALKYAAKHRFVPDANRVDMWSKKTGVTDRERFVLDRYMIYTALDERKNYTIEFARHETGRGESFFWQMLDDPELSLILPPSTTEEELGRVIRDILHKGIARFEPDFFNVKDSTDSSAPADTKTIDLLNDGPLAFGYKMSWLSVKTNSSEKVINALGFNNICPISWKVGLASVDITGESTFISNPLDGNVLALGVGDLEIKRLKELANAFEDVQYFLTHRVVDYHAWAYLKSGKLIRAYKFLGESGEVMWDEGSPLKEEGEIGLFNLAQKDGNWPDDVVFPSEQQVIDLAARLGIDPLFRDTSYPKQSGYLCKR